MPFYVNGMLGGRPRMAYSSTPQTSKCGQLTLKRRKNNIENIGDVNVHLVPGRRTGTEPRLLQAGEMPQ